MNFSISNEWGAWGGERWRAAGSSMRWFASAGWWEKSKTKVREKSLENTSNKYLNSWIELKTSFERRAARARRLRIFEVLRKFHLKFSRYAITGSRIRSASINLLYKNGRRAKIGPALTVRGCDRGSINRKIDICFKLIIKIQICNLICL